MRLLYTTYRYGILANDDYHCDEVQDFPEYNRLYVMKPDLRDTTTGETTTHQVLCLTVVDGDTFVTLECETTCERHTDAAKLVRLPREGSPLDPLGGEHDGYEERSEASSG